MGLIGNSRGTSWDIVGYVVAFMWYRIYVHGNSWDNLMEFSRFEWYNHHDHQDHRAIGMGIGMGTITLQYTWYIMAWCVVNSFYPGILNIIVVENGTDVVLSKARAYQKLPIVTTQKGSKTQISTQIMNFLPNLFQGCCDGEHGHKSLNWGYPIFKKGIFQSSESMARVRIFWEYHGN